MWCEPVDEMRADQDPDLETCKPERSARRVRHAGVTPYQPSRTWIRKLMPRKESTKEELETAA